ncbi:MAG: LysE family transporter [Bacteroidales bacterium]|nr:LysE family transporter [Bacteroidales bacterium]
MIETLEFFITGATLGLIAGITPGPLLTMVISETMKYNRKEGMKIALAPLFSDLPIVALSLLILAKMSDFGIVLGMISLAGAVFLLYMAYETINIKPAEISTENSSIHSFRKGILANILSPHAYLFWMLVGAPITLKALKLNLLAAVLFVLGFYIFITGSKMLMAIISEKTKNIFSNTAYMYLMRFLGIVLIVFAIILIKDGFVFIGVI